MGSDAEEGRSWVCLCLLNILVQHKLVFRMFIHDVTLLVQQMQRSLTRDFHPSQREHHPYQGVSSRTRKRSTFLWSYRLADLLFWSTVAPISDTAHQLIGVVINHLLRALETTRTPWRSQMGSVELYCSFLSLEITARLCLRCTAVCPVIWPSCQLCSRGVVKHRHRCHTRFQETECRRYSPAFPRGTLCHNGVFPLLMS